ncbi:MAG: chemotaxis protein CheA [Planctomycetia bacterium]
MVGANANEEFVQEFLVESTENLDQLDRDLIALEQAPGDEERLASIFRTVHTIKGNSGFFGFSKLGALTHSGEHLLGRLRDGKLRLDDRVTGSLYSMVDAVRAILRTIETTGSEGDHDFRDLAQRLTAVAAGEQVDVPRAPATVAPAAEETPPAAEPATAASTPAVNEATPEPTGAPASPAASAVPTPPATSAPAAERSAAESSIRVDVGLVGSILDLVGELVLARNELRSIDTDDPTVLAAAHRINAVTNALQETAVKTRLQPIENVFNKFPRTVRDLAVACGKEVTLSIDGGDTELDRTLIESIRDPLTHLVRNAVDHGIEPPDVRVARGKPPAGSLALRAFNESGQVTIEVEDDGGGIAVATVRDKAVAKGLVSAEQAATLPDERILQFIFEPGFSTAATVTSVSGRGVGMDVVRTNIEAIGGTFDLHSRPGVGTTVRVRVPLTLAIMPALVVRVASERLAIPQAAVLELVPLKSPEDRDAAHDSAHDSAHDRPRIEGLDDAPVIRLRGRLLPVVFLDEFLGLRDRSTRRAEGTAVIVRIDDHEFGLVIDGVRHGTSTGVGEVASLSTVVVKPIGSLLAQIGLYAGATVLGDGGVVLILDLRGILRAADLPPVREAERTVAAAAASLADRYLVCRTARGRRIALPLEQITRLENVPAARLESLGERQVVRRGDAFTPVVDADRLLGGGTATPLDTLNLVVFGGPEGPVGLAVGRILDVLPAESPLQPGLAAPGVCGTLALGGLATEVLDLSRGIHS